MREERVWSAAEMVSLQFLLFSSAVAIVIAAVYLRSKRKQKLGKFPPGYNGWPIIGEIVPFMETFRVGTLGNFMEQRISRFGRIFSTNLLGQTTILSADAELNRFVLQNDMRLFEFYIPEHLKQLFGNTLGGALMSDEHKKMRSLITTYLTSSTLQTTVLPNINEVAKKIFSSWENGSVHNIVTTARQYTCDVISKTTLGMNPDEPKIANMREYAEVVAAVFITIFPINLPGTAYNKSIKLKKMVKKTLKQIYEERTGPEGKKTEERNDFLDWVIKTSNLSSEKTSDLLIDFLVGGTVSTSLVISSIIYFLHGCPKALEQLKEEHLQVGRQDGTVELTWENYKKMNFTQCIINETLRVLPEMVMKKATADIQYKGYEIPRGSIFVLNISGAHLDPSLFENPQVYNPWQWLDTTGIKKTNNFMPFGGGPRLCPGAELAKLEMAVFLHHLILNYKWTLETANMSASNRQILFPIGVPVKVQTLAHSS